MPAIEWDDWQDWQFPDTWNWDYEDADMDDIYAGTALGIADIEDNTVRRVVAPGYFAQALLAEGDKLWAGTLEEGMFEVPLAARPGRGFNAAASTCPACSIRKIFRLGDSLFTLASDSLWRNSEQVLAPDAATLNDRNISAIAAASSFFESPKATRR